MRFTPHMALPAGVDALSGALLARGFDALLVGGAVRDAVLGIETADFDLATTATPEQVREAAAGVGGIRGVYALGERFGTVGVALEGGEVLEITTLQASGATIAERFAADAAQRDFTLNAMAVDLATGALLDPTGGREDLALGLLRAPGHPEARFAEDPIRVVRASRLIAQFGFELELATRAAMPAVAPRLADIAVERIRDELTKLLMGAHVTRGLESLQASGALAVVLPEVAALDGATQPSFHDLDVLAHTFQTVAAAPVTPALRWAALLHDVGKGPARSVEADGRIRFFGHAQEGARIAEGICTRLRFSNADKSAVVHLVAEHMRLGDLHVTNPRAVDRAVRKLDLWAGTSSSPGGRRLVSAEDALELTLADFSATAHRDEEPRVRERLAAAIAESRARGTHAPPRSPVGGDQLMREFGLDEGPAVGRLIDAIEAAIDEGTLGPEDREGALEIARRELESPRTR